MIRLKIHHIQHKDNKLTEVKTQLKRLHILNALEGVFFPQKSGNLSRTFSSSVSLVPLRSCVILCLICSFRTVFQELRIISEPHKNSLDTALRVKHAQNFNKIVKLISKYSSEHLFIFQSFVTRYRKRKLQDTCLTNIH